MLSRRKLVLLILVIIIFFIIILVVIFTPKRHRDSGNDPNSVNNESLLKTANPNDKIVKSSYLSVPNQYIITFKPEITFKDATSIASHFEAVGHARVLQNYRHVFNGFSAEIPDSKLVHVLSHPAILKAEKNGIVKSFGGQEKKINPVKFQGPVRRVTPSPQKPTPSPQKLAPSSQKPTPSPQKLAPSPQKPTPSAKKSFVTPIKLTNAQKKGMWARKLPASQLVSTPKIKSLSTVNSWGINRIGAKMSSARSGSGEGIVNCDIYILDTGVEESHPELNVVESISVISTEPDLGDRNGHGTHVAGLAAAYDNYSQIIGTAPGARIHSIKVLDSSGNGDFSTVIAGVEHVTAVKNSNPSIPIVVNLSLGSYTGNTTYTALDTAVKNSIATGITYCIAAGNDSADASHYSPAHVAEALTIGSYNQKDRFAHFSNHGKAVKLLAPGVNVLSTYTGDKTASLSGTSMSTSLVTGVVALYLSQKPKSTPQQVSADLIRSASSAGSNAKIKGAPKETTNVSVWQGSF